MSPSSPEIGSDLRYARTQACVVEFLSALESVQQSIRFNDIVSAQRELTGRVADGLDQAAGELEPAPSDADRELRAALLEIVTHCARAFDLFRADLGWPAFATNYFNSRGEQCRALELLYVWRDALPLVEQFFRLDGIAPPAASAPEIAELCGIQHHAMNSEHGNYSLYVPESYDPQRRYPLIVCLHGSTGRGDEYLWTWLRAARSRGYFVLSPKSYAITWSMMQPGLDGDSILAMMDEVAAAYALDSERVLLTGLSDGGTFSYLLGLNNPERFAACAPIAGVLSPALDATLRAGRGKELPLHVVHGVHDMIFPVQSIRSTNVLLERLGYQLTYTELPDWGHALTYRINEQIVLPWFDELNTS